MEGFFQEIEEMLFATIEEFYEKKDLIRKKYKELDCKEARVYKWYFFYQVCVVDYKFKSAMWDYVCCIGGSEEKLEHFYEIFKIKKENYHLKYLLEEEKKKNL